MTQKTETSKKSTELKNTEREYIIPLREKCRVVPRYKKSNKAVKTIKEFLARHMKIRDRDLNKIKIDRYLNEFVWFRGIRRPPAKVKVRAIKENDGKGNEIIRAKLAEMPEKIKFKKLREEKIEKEASEAGKKKVIKKEETSEKPVEETEKSKEKEKEEKEKKEAVIEAGKQMEKAEAKKSKHQVKDKVKQSKHQVRKALAK